MLNWLLKGSLASAVLLRVEHASAEERGTQYKEQTQGLCWDGGYCPLQRAVRAQAQGSFHDRSPQPVTPSGSLTSPRPGPPRHTNPLGAAVVRELYGSRHLHKLCLDKTKYHPHLKFYSEKEMTFFKSCGNISSSAIQAALDVDPVPPCPQGSRPPQHPLPPTRKEELTSFLSCAGTWLKYSQACQNKMFSSLNSFLRKS